MKNTTVLLHYACLILGFSLQDAKEIVAIVAFSISIIFGIIGFILKLMLYLKDKKLDKEEIEDLINDVNELKNKNKGDN